MCGQDQEFSSADFGCLDNCLVSVQANMDPLVSLSRHSVIVKVSCCGIASALALSVKTHQLLSWLISLSIGSYPVICTTGRLSDILVLPVLLQKWLKQLGVSAELQWPLLQIVLFALGFELSAETLTQSL